MLKIEITEIVTGDARDFTYPVDLALCSNLSYAHDMTFVLADGPDELLSVDGVSVATEADETALISPVDLLAERQALAKMECARRIVAVVDPTAQMNLVAAAASEVLTTQQQFVYQQGVLWINACRENWPSLAASSDDITDDANWTEPSSEVVALGAAF